MSTNSAPSKVKVLKGYKKRLQKMIAAQKDANGNFKSNPEAEVAQAQLMQVQRDIISSSLKIAKLSLSVVILPFADPRAYMDRLNQLFTPSGWTR